MRAILVIPEGSTAAADGPSSSAFANLIDRPFCRHVVEFAVTHGVTSIDFVGGSALAAARRLFADGRRWGCEFRYHVETAGDADRLTLALRLASAGSAALLTRADCLPFLPLREWLAGAAAAGACTTTFYGAQDAAWTGWAILQNSTAAAALAGLDATARQTLPSLLQSLEEQPGTQRLFVDEVLSSRDRGALWQAHRYLLEHKFSGLLVTGREISPGVWLGRNASIDKTAVLEAPVYIGENSRVGAQARIGPYSAVAPDCLVSRRTHVVHSVICPNSFVGSNLELDQVVVDRRELFHVELDVSLRVNDTVLFDKLLENSIGEQFKRFTRALTALLPWKLDEAAERSVAATNAARSSAKSGAEAA